MKTIFAILALLVASCYAAPAKEGNAPVLLDKPAESPMVLPVKGEAPIKPVELVKGDENALEEEKGEFWIPFWDFFSGLFTTKREELPKSNNEMRMAKADPINKRPNRADFDDSGEFLEAENIYHFGESEETQELVQVDSEEVRYANYKAPEHVKDAILYGKVMPKQSDFSDYGDFLEASSRHLMEPVVAVKSKAQPKIKKTWNTWFGH